jgi:hypothetical protein
MKTFNQWLADNGFLLEMGHEEFSANLQKHMPPEVFAQYQDMAKKRSELGLAGQAQTPECRELANQMYALETKYQNDPAAAERSGVDSAARIAAIKAQREKENREAEVSHQAFMAKNKGRERYGRDNQTPWYER